MVDWVLLGAPVETLEAISAGRLGPSFMLGILQLARESRKGGCASRAPFCEVQQQTSPPVAASRRQRQVSNAPRPRRLVRSVAVRRRASILARRWRARSMTLLESWFMARLRFGFVQKPEDERL